MVVSKIECITLIYWSESIALPEYLGTSSAEPGPTPRIGRLSSRPLSKDWLLSNGPPCGLDPRWQLLWSDVSHSCRKARSRVCSKGWWGQTGIRPLIQNIHSQQIQMYHVVIFFFSDVLFYDHMYMKCSHMLGYCFGLILHTQHKAS